MVETTRVVRVDQASRPQVKRGQLGGGGGMPRTLQILLAFFVMLGYRLGDGGVIVLQHI